MVTDSSTNLERLNWFISWANMHGWAQESIRGAAANSAAESHAWLESGDTYASSKYFNYCVYGGTSPFAGYDWYSQGASISGTVGAYGFFQWLSANDPSLVSTWMGFFSNGNTQTNANAQLAWWFGSDGQGTGAGYGWIPGGDVSFTEDPSANSNVSFADWAKNTNGETDKGQASIFYANFERAGASQYPGHTITALDALTSSWGLNWATSTTHDNTGDTGNKKQFPPCYQASNKGKPSPPPANGTNVDQGIIANGKIHCIDPLVSNGQCVGSNAQSIGQCYGLAQWWFEQCGGGRGALQGGNCALYASQIYSCYPWGSGAFAGFTATAGASPPTGGWKTGDIVCMTSESEYGHVIVVGGVASDGTIQTWYEQNNWSIASPCGTGYAVAYNTNSPMSTYYSNRTITGTVRPSKFPTCANPSSASSPSPIMPFASARTNFLDISSAQEGLNFTTLTPAPDGVIIKATQGTSYTDPFLDGWTNTVQANKWMIGFYHYLDGSGAIDEATHFVQSLKAWNGHGYLFADWESNGNPGDAGYNPEFIANNTDYLLDFLNEVKKQAGITPGFYTAITALRGQDFSKLTEFPCWFAQWANNDPTTWQTLPWYDGLGFGSYTGEVIGQQYTPNLQIGQNISGGMDGSQFTLDSSQWQDIATSGGQPPTKNFNNPATKDPCSSIGLQALLNQLHNKYILQDK
jgi:GH25 family lysozyme M1 (1,4-beta-N-acetylmuramidase)